MRKNTKNTSKPATERARRFRQEMSVSKRIVWDLLRNREHRFKFRRQYAAGPYFLDFYCREASLAVEVDGIDHLINPQRDEARDAWLAGRGILVVRIPTSDMFEEAGMVFDRWIDRIIELCEERAGPSPPGPLSPDEPQGRGERR
jgi:very-short-patch-repair endonuclease